MQRFSKEVFDDCVRAIEGRQVIEFLVPKVLTSFKNEDLSEWKPYPPLCLPSEEYLKFIVMAAGEGIRGALMIVEIMAHLAGALTFYKEIDPETVAVRVTWPKG